MALWQTLSREIVGSVETSIQIFDRFIMKVYEDSREPLADTEFLAYAAACSSMLAVKLLDAKSQLNMVWHNFLAQVI